MVFTDAAALSLAKLASVSFSTRADPMRQKVQHDGRTRPCHGIGGVFVCEKMARKSPPVDHSLGFSLAPSVTDPVAFGCKDHPLLSAIVGSRVMLDVVAGIPDPMFLNPDHAGHLVVAHRTNAGAASRNMSLVILRPHQMKSSAPGGWDLRRMH